MSRFADSPYFLLKDFMTELVAPANPELLQPDIVNDWSRVVFTDIIHVGGDMNYETSTPLVDTLDRYDTFDPNTDQAQIFTSDDVAWNGWIDRSPSSIYHLGDTDINGTSTTVGVMLRSGDNSANLVVNGGSYIDLYAKKDEYGFVSVRLKPVYEEPRDKVYFRFDLVEASTLLYDGAQVIYDSDDPVDEPYYDSAYVSIQTEDYTYETSPVSGRDLDVSEILDNGTEIYFRKDSAFHNWLKNFAHDFYETQYEVDFIIRNYVNTDKTFIYFGKIYPTVKESELDPDRYHIVFNGLKDWVREALPVNNRKDNLVEFLDTYFDQVYSEGYELLKNVWTLRDGRECDQRFLGYIPTFHGLEKSDNIPDWFSDSFREYASELVWLMKRKGTYASLQIVYELLTANSQNILSIMERWHEDGVGVISDYSDHIYTGLYGKDEPIGTPGAGYLWYSKYDADNYPEGYLESDNMVLSPYYRVDLDLNVEPITQLEILPKEISEAMYYNWEIQRPVNRQAEYNLIYAPYTDLTGDQYSLYERPNTFHSISKSIDNVSFDADNYLHIQRISTTSWSITHGLGTKDVIVSTYTEDFEKQVPSKIKITDENRVLLEFDQATVGIAIISKAANLLTTYDPVSWRIRHGFNRKEVLFQVRSPDDVVYYPDSAYIGDDNTLYIEGAEIADSETLVKTGISLGDAYDSDGDGVNDSTLTTDVWVFDSVDLDDSGDAKEVTKYTYNGVEWWAWVIDHPYVENIFQVNCYDDNNRYREPAEILLNELDPQGNPQVVVLWNTVADTVDASDYLGFAAIDNVGDIVAFYGIVPKNASGDLLNLRWRLTIETDDEIYTFLREGDDDANTLFAGKDKTIHYFDGVTTSYPWGVTELQEEDDEWYYYTFTVDDEALKQLNIRDYKIIAVELINTRIKRVNKQRVFYSRLSGIYKPLGVNFIGHFRIFKDLSGIGTTLFDENGDVITDENGDPISA